MSPTAHLSRRSGVWYYRRRVPLALTSSIGRQIVQFSLGTTDLKEAKKRRAAEDLKWATRFETATDNLNLERAVESASALCLPSADALTEREVVRLVQDYVEHADGRARQRSLADPPADEDEKAQIKRNIEVELSILKNKDDPRADEVVHEVGSRILRSVGRAIDDQAGEYATFAEWVRRGLLEVDRRRLGRINDDHLQSFFDPTFKTGRLRGLTFGELAEQFISIAEEEAEANKTSQKWVDQQRAIVAVLREIAGSETEVMDIDYDACLRVRSVIARVPANRNKLYPGSSVDEAVAMAEAEGKATLSPVTQARYPSA